MAVNKVEFGDQVVMDITDSTADANNMLNGTIAYKANGERVVGGLTVVDVEANPAANATDSLNKIKVDDTVYNFNDLLEVNETLNVAPYVKRAIPSGAYTEKMKSIIGASVVWNQRLGNGNFESTSGWTTSDSSLTVSGNIGSFTATAQNGRIANSFNSPVSGHIYLFKVDVKANTTNVAIQFWTKAKNPTTTGNFETIYIVNKIDYTGGINYPRILDQRTSGWDEIQVKNAYITDLTTMFGGTIADYVNTLETQTAGSGIAWLKSYGFFTGPYYAYSANKIESVSVSGKKNVGKNFANPTNISVFNSNKYFSTLNYSTTPMYPVKASTQYVLSCRKGTPSVNQDFRIYYWDSNNTVISNEKANPFTTPNNCAKISFYCGYSDGDFTDGENVKAQVEEGSIATPYEPCKEWQTTLDHTTLRGLFKLDANNNLYADGDIYPSSGNGEVKWHEWNLGDFTWTRDTTRQTPTFYCTLSPAVKSIPNNWSTNFICEKYLPSVGATTDKTASIFVNSRFYICDSAYTDATDFGNAMSGVKLVAELNTPTTTTLTPYSELQNIENGGTEEFIDYVVEQSSRDVAIPAGTETYFGDNKLVKDVEDIASTKQLNYSTSEQATGQKWIDGSDIYRRTFTGTIDSNTHGTTEIADFTNLQPIACNGWFMDTSGLGMALGYFPNSTSWSSALHIDPNHKLLLFTESALASGTYYVTVDYIKTT